MSSGINVSVIVPVYNVEKYLRKCLDSLVNQTLQEIEIIVVNDGSTDSSQLIIDEYAEKYHDKIIPFIKENGGLGDARNYGISKARGRFIGFVDSDDWVDPKMYNAMYEMTKEGHDIVMCDMMIVPDGWETGHVAKSFRGTKFKKRDLILHSTDPAISCNKLYDSRFFKLFKFSNDWYEDVGTTPILLSYSNSVGYLEFPLYYYRQRMGSITNSDDSKTVGVKKSWQRIIDNVNEQYKAEAIFAVYKSIVNFIEFKPKFADDFICFAQKIEPLILKNPYYQNAVKNKEILDLLSLKLIPKKIHYFWFGGGKKSELIEQCIESWKKYASDYEIIEWNESNCNLEENQYVKEAYEAKKWAFVADYFRIKVIYEHGGIYVDTDVEFTNSIEGLRINNAFFEFETKNDVNAAIMGAVPKNSLIKKCLDSYEKNHFRNIDGSFNISNTIVKRLTKLLINDSGIILNGQTQLLEDNVRVYSPNILTIDVYDGKNIAIHHYDASWWDVKEKVSYKNAVLKDYFGGDYESTIHLQNKIIEYQKLIQLYENTLSWKITSPLRKIRALIRRKTQNT